MKKMALRTNQYVTFRLGEEVFALDVGNAREIVEFSTIVKIPQTKEWVRGIINLRGEVLPVLDLKLKFGMGMTEQTVDSCIIVIETKHNKDELVIGVLADAVNEVFEMPPEALEPPPKVGTSVAANFIRGVGRRNDQLFIVLEAGKVFSSVELEIAQHVGESGVAAEL